MLRDLWLDSVVVCVDMVTYTVFLTIIKYCLTFIFNFPLRHSESFILLKDTHFIRIFIRFNAYTYKISPVS